MVSELEIEVAILVLLLVLGYNYILLCLLLFSVRMKQGWKSIQFPQSITLHLELLFLKKFLSRSKVTDAVELYNLFFNVILIIGVCILCFLNLILKFLTSELFLLAELPKVRWVLPDSYLDVRNKDYGGTELHD